MAVASFDIAKIERLINISKNKPLLPEKFVPWNDIPKESDIFLPEKLVSLAGHPLYETLTRQQKIDLGKHEIAQVIYSYAWSEGLACLFFNRHLLTLTDNTSVEYRFLLRELIEEFRHQNMFSDTIMKLGVKPIKPGFQHRFWGKLTVKYLPSDFVFMSVLAVEVIAESYGQMLRRDENVYSVLRKVSELHQIEEGRHIHYTKMWLHKFTHKAGFIKRSTYSFIFLLNIYFMRTLYVKEAIFEKIGVDNPRKYQKVAYKNYRKKFAQHCLEEAIDYVHDFNGFNWFTRPFWQLILKAKV